MDAEAPTEILRPPIPAIASTSREQCAACGAVLAPDQRYCVECGQRRRGAQPPFFDGSRAPRAAAGGSAALRRPLMSINATLLAGVGTLLLAMGIGILIGRSGQGSGARTPAVQLVTAAGTGAAATGATPTGVAPGSEAALPGSSTTPASNTATKSTGSSSTPKPKSKSSRPPAPKSVKVGSKGSGPGYEKGKFTGNFFGEGEE